MDEDKKKKLSPSEELLRGAGGRDDDYVLSSPVDDSAADDATAGMSAEEIAAELAGTAPAPTPPPPSEWSPPSPPAPAPPARTSRPAVEGRELEDLKAELRKRNSPRSSRRSRLDSNVRIGQKSVGIRTIVVLGFAAVFVGSLVFSLFDKTESIAEQHVGDCFIADVGTDDLKDVESVDCSELHNGEVLAIIDASELGPGFPGDDRGPQWLLDQCIVPFENYTGLEIGERNMLFVPLMPTESSWQHGDREGMCVIVTVDADFNVQMVSGSARNAGSNA